MNTKGIFWLLTILLSTQISSAQIVDRTTDRAKDKTNNRVDNKIDQGIDKSLDAIEGVFKRKPKEDKKKKEETPQTEEEQSQAAAESMLSGGLFGGQSNAQIKDAYKFDHRVSMTMEMTDKKGEKSPEQQMQMYFSESDPEIGIRTMQEGMNSLMVMDMGNKVMVMLMDVGESKMLMTIPLNGDLLSEEEEEKHTKSDDFTFTKTGRTKTILGYTCEEYIGEDKESTSVFWVTKDEDFGITKAFAGMAAASKKSNSSMPQDAPGGMMMEMTNTNKKNPKEEMKLTVTEVKKNISETISTKGYTKMGFGG
jgi:hypothetical protein